MVVEINISIVEKNVWITERFFDNHYNGCLMLKFGGLNIHTDIQVQYAIFKNRRYVADPGEVLEVVSKPHLVSDGSVVRISGFASILLH